MAAPTMFNAAVSNPGGTGSTITVTLSTHAVDDVLFVHIFNTGNALWAGNPAGWTRIDQRTVGTSSSGIVGSWFFHKVVSGDSIPLSSPVFTLGATSTRAAICRTIRGADLEGPFTLPEYGARGFSTGTANPIRPPTVSTLAPEMLVLNCYGSRTATNAPEPSGYTQDQEVIISGTLVVNASSKTVADQNTSLANQDASPTSGVRWAAATVCIPSPDYPYYRAGAQATTASGTSVSPAKPTGTTNSDVRGNADVMIATIEGAGITTLSAADGALWSEISGWTNTTDADATSVKKFWCYATASPNMQFNRTGTGEISACITTYHNCHQTNPLGNVISARTSAGLATTWPALTRGSPKVTVQSSSVADGVPTYTTPAPWLERMDGLGIVCADQTYNATGVVSSTNVSISVNSASLGGRLEILGLMSVVVAAIPNKVYMTNQAVNRSNTF